MRLYELIFYSVFYVRLRRIREVLLRTITILLTKFPNWKSFRVKILQIKKQFKYMIIAFTKKSGYTRKECWNLRPVCPLWACFSTDCADLEYI